MENPLLFWESRYSAKDYVYGIEPNQYFRQYLDRIPKPGRILLLAEGEGRNAVYAAQKGWSVTAVDFSANAREKALALAAQKGVELDYRIARIEQFDIHEGAPWDAIGLIYAHFAPGLRQNIHQKCVGALRQGGSIVLEAFNPLQINRMSGGPRNMEMLYTKTMIEKDFASLDIAYSAEETVVLNEGEGHAGLAEVTRGHFIKNG